MQPIDTDYLVIGSGTAGLAFADTLIAATGAASPAGTGTTRIRSSRCTSRRRSTA
jgi:succinate dehydrogenase/fumarate reductase flavoprotein subunit